MTALLSLGARVEAPDLHAAQGVDDSRAGRLGELARWLATTRRDEPGTAVRNVRCLVLGEVSPAITEFSEQLNVDVRPIAVTRQGFAAFEDAVAAADAEVDSGADLLVLASGHGRAHAALDAPGIAARALISALTGAEPIALLPRGADAVDSEHWIGLAGRLRDSRLRMARMRNRPDDLLEVLNSAELCAATGFALQSAARRTPLILDGVTALAAAVLAMDVQLLACQWWQVAATSRDRAHQAAVQALGLRPILDLESDLDGAVAGLLAVTVLRGAVVATRGAP